jgi:hypothetical protein
MAVTEDLEREDELEQAEDEIRLGSIQARQLRWRHGPERGLGPESNDNKKEG